MRRDLHTVTIPIEDYERMRDGLERYEFVRCLNVSQFKEMLFDRSLADGIPFDKLVDIERSAAKVTPRAKALCKFDDHADYIKW